MGGDWKYLQYFSIIDNRKQRTCSVHAICDRDLCYTTHTHATGQNTCWVKHTTQIFVLRPVSVNVTRWSRPLLFLFTCGKDFLNLLVSFTFVTCWAPGTCIYSAYIIHVIISQYDTRVTLFLVDAWLDWLTCIWHRSNPEKTWIPMSSSWHIQKKQTIFYGDSWRL